MCMYHSATFDEPLLVDLACSSEKVFKKMEKLPPSLQRKQPLKLPDLDETQLVRHFLHLSQMNFGIDSGMYPLGSCTMKYNPKLSETISGWEQFQCVHPYQEGSTIQGSLEVMYEVERWLATLTGMEQFTLQPAAGAQGEFTGLLLAKAYHEAHGDFQRKEVILPDTAHGTNPASATMAGFKLVEISSTAEGTVNIDELEKAVSENTAVFMLTNPNTLCIFESDIQQIARVVHKAGGLLYYDGANMNAIMGKTRPGDMGFDMVHVNLHKTFSTPHGGGGPGSGPVGVKQRLEPFLPVPRVEEHNGEYFLSYDYEQSIGKIKSFYGNFPVILKAYVYMLLMGGDGLTRASEVAVLNANYLKHRLTQNKAYELPFRKLRKHEFVVSSQPLKAQKDIKALDIAKRLLDYGVHPPTVYFPLIVKEALMIEPTETESKASLDTYVQILHKIAEEDPDIVKAAPTTTPVHRVDEAKAAKEPILTWDMRK